MLKLIDVSKDFYNRFKLDHLNSIEINYENDVDVDSRYKIKKIIKRRQRIFDRTKI